MTSPYFAIKTAAGYTISLDNRIYQNKNKGFDLRVETLAFPQRRFVRLFDSGINTPLVEFVAKFFSEGEKNTFLTHVNSNSKNLKFYYGDSTKFYHVARVSIQPGEDEPWLRNWTVDVQLIIEDSTLYNEGETPATIISEPNISDFTVTIYNPNGTTLVPPLIDAPIFESYLDISRKAQIKVPKFNAINELGTAKLTYQGVLKLVGFIKRFDRSNTLYDTVTILSAEDLLNDRASQWYRYPAGTTINQMLSESPGASVVGLLAMANSLIPNGSWETHSGYVWKLRAGGGTSSRWGTISQLYENTTLLSKVGGIPTAAGQWYQSSSTLYIWTTDNDTPNNHLILAPNCKDTKVRLGTIENGGASFPVALELSAETIFPVIQAIIASKGLEWSFRPSGSYVYLDAETQVGSGSLSSPVDTFTDGLDCEVRLLPVDGMGRISALIGQGAGAGLTQVAASALDLSTKGFWRESIYPVPGLFYDMLKGVVDKVFLDHQEPTIYSVESLRQNWNLGQGDFVKINMAGYAPVTKRIKHISMKGGGMVLECGQRLRTLAELIRGEQDILRRLTSFLGVHSPNSYSWSFGPDNVDNNVSLIKEFELKSSEENGVIDETYPYEVLLDVSIGWYHTDQDASGSSEALSHGAVGGHGGYGGGGGGSGGGGQTHTLQNPVIIPGVNQLTVHSILSMQLSGPAAVGGVAKLTTDSPCCPICHVPPLPHGHDLEASADQHLHTYAEELLWVSPWNHSHGGTPGSGLTGESPNAYMSPQNRAGPAAHPGLQSVMEPKMTQKETGSVTYLTLVVKCNGTAVPGSPFNGALGTGLYIGDDLEDIVIKNLVTIGQKNSLEFIVSAFGGGGEPARCSLSGSVSIRGIISL